MYCGNILEPIDRVLPSLLVYRANSGPLPRRVTEAKIALVATDPATKSVLIPPPRNRKEALLSPWWKGYYSAELAEMESHKKNKTWVLRPRADVPGTPILRGRWAYDDKLSPGGKGIERFKARLTAMGCFQKEGVDYPDIYASVMAFRYLLQMYNSQESNSSEHWDVSTAFIHAPLKEQVWMKQASGHEEKGRESWVCLLLKALYGTKQAANAWKQHLKELMVAALILDPATYVKHEGQAWVIVGTHVDDLFVLSCKDGRSMKEQLWKHLVSKLSIKTLTQSCGPDGAAETAPAFHSFALHQLL